MSQTSTDKGPNFVIWGTDVIVSKCKTKFKQFIQDFVVQTPDEDEISREVDNSSPLYMQKLEEVKFIKFLNL